MLFYRKNCVQINAQFVWVIPINVPQLAPFAEFENCSLSLILQIVTYFESKMQNFISS